MKVFVLFMAWLWAVVVVLAFLGGASRPMPRKGE